MNERTLQALEYNKIISQLKKHAETSLGEELIEQLQPATDLKTVQKIQQETDEAMQILRLNQRIPLGGIFDIRPSLKRSKIGGVLNVEECLNVASTIYGGRQVKNFIKQMEEDFPLLRNLVQKITSLRDLEKEIRRCIDDQGQVQDHATASLRSIRSTMRTTEHQIRERLNHYTQTKSHLLTEAIITIRNDRYVLPVKYDQQRAFGGIVHDRSASGQTLFVEPQAILEKNNTLQHLQMKEQSEIEKILRQLSKAIAKAHDVLQENVSTLAQIDLIHAKALLAKEMKASMPTMNDKGIIKMQQARHPLIPQDQVVANDIELGDQFQAIVITGPNTGGKTVTLKLIGLCTLMAQAGLQIPALDGCELAVFDRVFADIGDEQSIEQNLSTFSSHMSHIVDIVKQVNDHTLVLFDELGAGTDPQEGAALAISILDAVIEKGARIIATTHYPELKAYGYNRENVVNASVEFDVNTLKPTYRLLMGVPGRSNAFDISRRLGLPEKIIDRAKNHIGIESESVDTMIGSLEMSTRKANKAYQEAERLLNESEALYNDLKKAWSTFLNERKHLYKQAEKKAKEAVDRAKRKAEKIVGQLRKQQQESFKEHQWIEARKQLDDAEVQLTDSTEAVVDDEKQRPLEKGDPIELLTVNQQGTVLEKINDDEYTVQVGMMRVNVKRKDLKLLEQQKEEQKSPVATVRGARQHVRPELDLRGKRYEDALHTLEQYIDDVLLAGYEKVTIIHGKGTGALRKGVQEFAKQHPHIASFHDGKAHEGGTGVTLIYLR